MSSAVAESEVARRVAPSRSRLLVFAAGIVAVVALAVSLYSGARYADETQKELRRIPYLAYDDRVDFGYFYAAAELVRKGDAKRLYPAKGEPVVYPGDPPFKQVTDEYELAKLLAIGNYYNPPALAIIEAPLSATSFRTAYWAFSALSLAALGAFVLLAWRAGRGILEMPLVILGMLAFKPVHEALIMGHMSLFFVLALGGGFLAVRSGRPVLAGMALSVLALKPQWAALPALFLLVRGQWRALAVMSALSAAIVLTPFLALGVDTFKNYVQFLRDASTIDLENAPHMFSWNGFLYKLHGSPGNETLIYGLIGLTAALVVIVWWGRDFYLGAAATVVGMLLVSTHSVWYDWSFLLVAALFLALRPSSMALRIQTGVVLIALSVAAGQSMAELLTPLPGYPDRHYIDWVRSAFYAMTPVTFFALVWMAGLTLWGRLPRPLQLRIERLLLLILTLLARRAAVPA